MIIDGWWNCNLFIITSVHPINVSDIVNLLLIPYIIC